MTTHEALWAKRKNKRSLYIKILQMDMLSPSPKQKTLDLIDKLETYEFVDRLGHPLENCKDWHDLKVELDYFQEADISEARHDLGNDEDTPKQRPIEEKKLRKLLWREYLRGFIDGGAKGREYNLATLKSNYRQYIKLNPEATKLK